MTLNNNLLLAVLGLVFLWLGALSFFIGRTLNKLSKLTSGTNKKDLLSILEKILRDSEIKSKQINDLLKEIEKINKENFHFVQKIGLVRFNPFVGTGGDQSFCLTLLDGEDTGLVISSLHSRDTTRIYAKPVKKGKAVNYELSVEEKQAIKNARKIH